MACPLANQAGGRRRRTAKRVSRKGRKSVRRSKRVGRKSRRTRRRHRGGQKITVDTNQVKEMMKTLLQ